MGGHFHFMETEMARTYAFSALKGEYQQRWEQMAITPRQQGAIDRAAMTILAAKSRYQVVAAQTGVPWAFIGVLHWREASCDFAGVLHNGEKILGTGRKTRLVPKGRGPFRTWEEAARDALALKGYAPGSPWSISRCLYEGERFNGFGYRMHQVPSAYLWSFSNQYVRGKYVADGVWSPTTVDRQMGIAPLMKRLLALDGDVSFEAATSAASSGPTAGDGLDARAVAALQQRLRDLGYFEVGQVDGQWGARTVAGLSAFQATAGLPLTAVPGQARVDTATAAALATASTRVVAPARAALTARDLLQRGDGMLRAAWWSKFWAWLIGAPALVIGVLEQAPEATGRLDGLRATFAQMPGWAWSLLVVGVALSLFMLSRRVEADRVAAVRSGRDSGPA